MVIAHGVHGWRPGELLALFVHISRSHDALVTQQPTLRCCDCVLCCCIQAAGGTFQLLKLDDSSGPVIEQLREALSKSFTRVIDLFKDWDDDGNGMVNKTEFRRVLPMLGLKVERDVAEQLFESFDADGSGEIDYKELHHHLRAGANIELDAALQDGAAGEITLEAKNAIALRADLGDTQRLEASALQGVVLVAGDAASVAEQLLKALDKNLMRIIDLFREWDDDGSGNVSKQEFRRALPCLGLKVDRASADALFDSFDDDHSGSVDYNELHRAIKRRSGNPPSQSPRKIPRPPPAVFDPGSTAPLKGDWKQAMQEESNARKKLLRLQREFEKVCIASARETYQAERRSVMVAARADMARRTGSDMTEKLAAVVTATKEEKRELSVRFNVRMLTLLRPGEQEWFNLFKAVDTDGSGRISFEELESMIRGPLKLSREKLATAKLHALWKAIDDDDSGWISTGEFGRFMKLGSQQAADHVAQKVAAAKAAKLEEGRLVKEETDRLVGRDVTARLADVPAATKDETIAFSKEFNEKIARIMLPHEQEWYRIFKQVDTDRSGRISLEEFTEIIRTSLKYPPEQLSNGKLKGLWKSLDEDQSGFISAGEFGRFMKLGEKGSQERVGAAALEAKMQRLQQKREQARAERLSAAQQEEAAQLRLQTQQMGQQKQMIEAEVARLQAALEEAQAGRRRRVNFSKPASTPRQPASVGSTPRGRIQFVDPRPPPSNPKPFPAISSSPRRPPVTASPGARAPRDTGKQWVDPRPPPVQDQSHYAVPFGGV